MQRKYGYRIYLILLMLILVVGFLFPIPMANVDAGEPRVDARIHFIDVGQGDATFIELPDGKTMLIDGGLEKYGRDVVKYIKNLGYTKIDYLVATHADEDHIGGLIRVLEKLDVETIYRPFTISTCVSKTGFTDELFTLFEEDLNSYATCADEVYAKFLKAAYDEKINGVPSKIKVCTDKENILSSDSTHPFMIRFFLPFAGAEFATDRIEKGYTTEYVAESNDSSALILLAMEQTSYLFAGDVTETKERKLIESLTTSEKLELASVTLLKVAHHGSASSTCDEFLSMVNPSHSVISVGEGNRYGLPSDTIITKLERQGSMIHRTDELGTIIVEEIAGVLHFKNIETKTFFEKFQWLFYLILGLILVGLILLIYLYPRLKKDNDGKDKLKFWQKREKRTKSSRFSEGPEDKNFS